MADYKPILGFISVVVAFTAYGIYFRQIFSGKIKPHAFSWFVWGLTTGIIFAAQIAKHGGAGAWSTGFTSLACFTICFIAILKGYTDFIIWDWIFFGAALASLLLWWFIKEPTPSVILLTVTDAVACLPTLRKAYGKPFEESAAIFLLNPLRSLIALFALQSYSLATWLNPTSLILTNTLVAFVILSRRRQLQS